MLSTSRNSFLSRAISSIYIRRYLQQSVMVEPVRSVALLKMPVILLFVLLVLFHIQPAQANYSVAIPLAVRSPYLSCWLPQINGTANATSHDAPSATTSDLSQVRLFSGSNASKHDNPFVGSRRKIFVSLFVSTRACTVSLDQLST